MVDKKKVVKSSMEIFAKEKKKMKTPYANKNNKL
jgi:hypothetical protein